MTDSQANDEGDNNEMSEDNPLGLPPELAAVMPPEVMQAIKAVMSGDEETMRELISGQSGFGIAKLDALFVSDPNDTAVVRLPTITGGSDPALMFGGSFIEPGKEMDPENVEHVHMGVVISPVEALNLCTGLLDAMKHYLDPMQTIAFASTVATKASKLSQMASAHLLQAEATAKSANIGDEADAFLRALVEEQGKDTTNGDGQSSEKDAPDENDTPKNG